jgi:hypothetical protein
MNQATSKLIKQFNIPKDLKGRRNWSAFMICVVIAMAIWFLIKLSNDSNYTTIDYPVVYKNHPADLVLVEKPDSNLSLGIKAQGFKLLSAKFFRKRKRIEVDLEKIQIKKSRPHHYQAFLATSRIVQKLTNQLKFSKELLSVYPDTLYFSLQDKINKRVPVVSKTKLSFKLPYQLYQPISFSPDSVDISGPYDLISKTNSIQTEEYSNDNIIKDIKETILLRNPNKDFICLSTNEVILNADIEKFTEESIDIPINCLPDSNANFSIKTFPEKVTVHYSVALKDFNRISPKLFEVIVETKGQDLKNRKMLRTKVNRFPDFVKITRITPEDVEFIIK